MISRAALFALVSFALAESSLGVPMPTLEWDAGSPGANPASQWQAAIGSHTWNVSGASRVLGGGAFPGLTAHYAFDGVADRIFGGSLSTHGTTNDIVSFEIWLRPAGLAGGPQVIFETGGRVDGTSFTLDDSQLLFRVLDSGNAASASIDLATLGLDFGEFFQVVGVLELGATASLYVNGGLVATSPAASINDWAGGGGAGIGDVNGRVGGTCCSGNGDLAGYGNFAGDVALLRTYEQAALTPSQVQAAFDAVPEPASGWLLSCGLVWLARCSGARERR